MQTPIGSVLEGVLRARLNDAAWTWLADTMGRAGDDEQLFQAYTAASRRIGSAPLGPAEVELAAARAAVPALNLAHWAGEDAARALLLLSRAEVAPTRADDFTVAAVACYEQGAAREQQSWLRGLPVLPQAESFLPHAIDACRGNILPLFESIACENPYPARWFPELNFNQMVLKALFNGVSLRRIVGLQARLNAELSRMAAAYASERRAAGRSVPSDISMAMTTQEDALEPR
jgi:hypothetical protein